VGSEARARLGLAALLGVTLISFSMLFRQGDYPGPVLIGVLVAAGIVILMRRLGAGIPLTLVVSAGALYWYLSLVFQSPHTFYGLPTLATGRGLVDSIQFAYTKSYIDFAPVAIRPGYVISTIAIMWIAATVGEIATFRLRRPLLASSIPVALFTFLLIVGTGAGAQFFVVVFIAALLTYWALESAHRLRSWGRWMPTWSHMRADAPTSIATGIARKMGASCVAAAIVAPVFLPLLGHGGISWRNAVGAGPDGGGGSGTTVSGNVDLLASITPETIRQSSETLFTVDAESESYWRLASLSRFDGKTWLQGPASRSTLGADGNVDTTLDPPRSAETLSQTIHIEGLEGTHLPAAVEPINVQSDKLTDLRTDRDSGDLEITPGVTSGMTYTVSSAVTDAGFDELRKADLGRPGDQYQIDPPGVTPEIEALRDEWIEGADTPFDKLVAIQEELRKYTYSLQVEPGTSSDDLADFLLSTKTGYCQQFATAFAVLSRSLRYPTRVSIGFLPGEQSPSDPTHFEVTGLQTHAWPEVYFDKFGWVRFEPTPRGIAPPPEWTVAAVGRPGDESGGPGGNGGTQGGHKFADGDIVNPFLRGGRANEGAEPDAGPRDTSPDWRPAFTRLMIVVFALGLLWALMVPGLKLLRVRNRYRRAASPRDVVGAAFWEFETEAAELATRKRPAESAAAFVERVASMGVLSRSAAARLGRLYDAAEYSTADVGANHAEEARRLAMQLRASMWRAAGIGRKTARLFSAKELLASRTDKRPLWRRLRPAAAATGLTSRV
jgi:transglutaminase-like putative cysteine protease